uniref:Secreted protein n=1 Tax=Globodera pallida TaxID=36090 RepID=A0A183BMJ1_GLOPA
MRRRLPNLLRIHVLKLALVCYRFDGLVDSHLKSRRSVLGSLKFDEKNGTGAELVKWEDDGTATRHLRKGRLQRMHNGL